MLKLFTKMNCLNKYLIQSFVSLQIQTAIMEITDSNNYQACLKEEDFKADSKDHPDIEQKEVENGETFDAVNQYFCGQCQMSLNCLQDLKTHLNSSHINESTNTDSENSSSFKKFKCNLHSGLI